MLYNFYMPMLVQTYSIVKKIFELFKFFKLSMFLGLSPQIFTKFSLSFLWTLQYINLALLLTLSSFDVMIILHSCVIHHANIRPNLFLPYGQAVTCRSGYPTLLIGFEARIL